MSTTESYLWGLARTAHIIPGLLLLSPKTQRRANLQRYGLSFHLEMTNMDGHLEGFTNTCPYFFHTFYITLFPKMQLRPHGQIPLRKVSVSTDRLPQAVATGIAAVFPQCGHPVLCLTWWWFLLNASGRPCHQFSACSVPKEQKIQDPG